jgi:hypothetical protein
MVDLGGDEEREQGRWGRRRVSRVSPSVAWRRRREERGVFSKFTLYS